jgi:hypothetical protein
MGTTAIAAGTATGIDRTGTTGTIIATATTIRIADGDKKGLEALLRGPSRL